LGPISSLVLLEFCNGSTKTRERKKEEGKGKGKKEKEREREREKLFKSISRRKG